MLHPSKEETQHAVELGKHNQNEILPMNYLLHNESIISTQYVKSETSKPNQIVMCLSHLLILSNYHTDQHNVKENIVFTWNRREEGLCSISVILHKICSLTQITQQKAR